MRRDVPLGHAAHVDATRGVGVVPRSPVSYEADEERDADGERDERTASEGQTGVESVRSVKRRVALAPTNVRA